MLLSGYPQATLPGLRDRLTSLRNRPRTKRFALPLATIVSVFPFILFFLFVFFQHELIELDGHNGLMRKSGC